ncbi:MAG: nucleoside-triphosphatase [Candidatus Bipolaricaulota bacterium]
MVDDLLRLILAHLESDNVFPLVVSGSVGAGKTRVCQEAANRLEGIGYQAGGVISPRIMDSGKTVGYDILDLVTGKRRSFIRSEPPGKKVGRFFLKPGSLEFANRSVTSAIGQYNPVFVDEVGRLELNHRGLAPSVNKLLDSDAQGIYLVRREFLSRFLEVFKITQYDEVEVEEEAS